MGRRVTLVRPGWFQWQQETGLKGFQQRIALVSVFKRSIWGNTLEQGQRTFSTPRGIAVYTYVF